MSRMKALRRWETSGLLGAIVCSPSVVIPNRWVSLAACMSAGLTPMSFMTVSSVWLNALDFV